MPLIRWKRTHLITVEEIWEAEVPQDKLDLAREDRTEFDLSDLDDLVVATGRMMESTVVGEPVDNELEYEEEVEA